VESSSRLPGLQPGTVERLVRKEPTEPGRSKRKKHNDESDNNIWRKSGQLL